MLYNNHNKHHHVYYAIAENKDSERLCRKLAPIGCLLVMEKTRNIISRMIILVWQCEAPGSCRDRICGSLQSIARAVLLSLSLSVSLLATRKKPEGSSCDPVGKQRTVQTMCQVR